MYYVGLQTLAQTVLEYIRKHELLKAGDRVGVAVSGGADSVALLRLLLELRGEVGLIPSVVHFNHSLRGKESDEDEQFVAELARTHKLDSYCESGDVRRYGADKRLSLETAARELRYTFFRELLNNGTLCRIATGHTLDDQAETVLLRIVRGAGSRGLAGIYPKLVVAGSERGAIVRPLLGTRREALEAHLRSLGQLWREDSSNRDLRHARNRVRHGILPCLAANLNPAVREALAETAEIARAEEEYWQEVTSKLLRGPDLAVDFLERLPLALRRRVIRAAAESRGLTLDFRHVEAVLSLAAADQSTRGSTELPAGWVVRSEKGHLHFCPPDESAEPSDYEHSLIVPGMVDIPEIGSRFEAALLKSNEVSARDPQYLLSRSALEGGLRVRNWRAGDRFWPAHEREPKKIKELLADKHVTGRERKLWPVVVSGDEIVWVRGFRTPQLLQPPTGAEALSIREVALLESKLPRLSLLVQSPKPLL
jgi:tRNA(Ile)-lysidine synthase